jgi:lipoate-protein ligase A
MARSPFINMAVDEILCKNSGLLGDTPLLRLYGWDRPSVSFGYAQKYPAELADRYAVVRRPTGGGIVYHLNDITYTFIVPPEHEIMRLDRIESYMFFHVPIQKMLQGLGVGAELAPFNETHEDREVMSCFRNAARHDVVAAGGKIAGAAQRRSRAGILHQGSILLDSLAKFKKEFLTDRLIDAFMKEYKVTFGNYEPDQKLIAAAEKLAEGKYSRPEWNVERKSNIQ